MLADSYSRSSAYLCVLLSHMHINTQCHTVKILVKNGYTDKNPAFKILLVSTVKVQKC